MSWPQKDSQRLPFLASIDLASLANVLRLDWLPREGRLLFFYDSKNQPWGFDPKDQGSWAVLHVDAPTAGLPASSKLPLQFIEPYLISSLPSYERPQFEALNLTEEQGEALMSLGDAAFGDAPRHQISGYPHPIQGDTMELECQLASNGIYVGEPAGYESEKARALADGARDWRLLLQFDSDDALKLMWGDAGIVYFWIREQDAHAGRFDKVWLVLQCH